MRIGSILTNLSEINLNIKELFNEVEDKQREKLEDEYIKKLNNFWDKYYYIKSNNFNNEEYIENFIVENKKNFKIKVMKKPKIVIETY